MDSRTIYEISFERAEYGRVKKAHLKPFAQEYNAIPVKHCREKLDTNGLDSHPVNQTSCPIRAPSFFAFKFRTQPFQHLQLL